MLVRIIEPAKKPKVKFRKKKHKTKHLISFVLILAVLVLLFYGLIAYFAPIPAPIASAYQFTSPAVKVEYAWPGYGQAAVGAVNYGLLDSSGETTPVPIASITKLITAMSIVNKKPLQLNDLGPLINFTQADVDIYNQYLAKNGAVIPISAGGNLTQLQALEAMLLPSANNIADSLAIWAFGSMDSYLNYANNYVKELGLSNTTINDASGFSPMTRSTAADLIILGEHVLNNPLLASIVSKKSTILPIVGQINNTNFYLGTNGTIGIKTGNTDEAGRCYLMATNRMIGDHQITIITAVLNATTLGQAVGDSERIATSATGGFGEIELAKAGQQVGHYQLYNGHRIAATVKDDLRVFGWRGQKHYLAVRLDDLDYPINKNKPAGLALSGNKSVNVVLTETTQKPGLSWRLRRWL